MTAKPRRHVLLRENMFDEANIGQVSETFKVSTPNQPLQKRGR